MEQSVLAAIEALPNAGRDKEALRNVLLKFYRHRSMEIILYLDEQGVGKVINYDNVKIGSTNNDE